MGCRGRLGRQPQLSSGRGGAAPRPRCSKSKSVWTVQEGEATVLSPEQCLSQARSWRARGRGLGPRGQLEAPQCPWSQCP